MISWDTDRDEFRLGQWLKGRIYEHRCDLSPSGQKLIYFVGSYRNPMRTWTAVSRPPFLTALLLWPKGDAWGGGGLFENERTILLNHGSHHRQLADGFHIPRTIAVNPLGNYAGRGEDDPIWSIRLERDGWLLKRKGKYRENKGKPRIWIEYIEKELRVKQQGAWTLEMLFAGISEVDGPWYLMEYRVVDQHGNVVLDLGRTDWADWSRVHMSPSCPTSSAPCRYRSERPLQYQKPCIPDAATDRLIVELATARWRSGNVNACSRILTLSVPELRHCVSVRFGENRGR